jgi:hypothetical protein
MREVRGKWALGGVDESSEFMEHFERGEKSARRDLGRWMVGSLQKMRVI